MKISSLHAPVEHITKTCLQASSPPEASVTRAAFAIPPEYQREPVDRLLKINEVVLITGMCRSSVYNRLREGQFVRSVKVGPRSIRFSESEVRDWISQRLLDRNTGGGHDAHA